MQLKHSQTKITTQTQDIQRVKDDYQMQLSYLVDKQTEMIYKEHTASQEKTNERNEMLIRQMCEAHNNETRTLRDRIADLQQQLKLKDSFIQSVTASDQRHFSQIDQIIQQVDQEYGQKISHLDKIVALKD